MIKQSTIDKMHDLRLACMASAFEDQCKSHAYDLLTFEELQEKVKTVRIFARVSPENKVNIVKAIKGACGKDFPVSLRYSVVSKTKGFGKGAVPGEEFPARQSRTPARSL